MYVLKCIVLVYYMKINTIYLLTLEARPNAYLTAYKSMGEEMNVVNKIT
jgi:hypothetical protein